MLTNLAHFSDHSGRPSLGRPQDALRHYAAAQAAFEALYGNAELVAAMDAATDPGSPPSAQWAHHNIANTLIGRALVHQRLGDFAAMRADAEASLQRRLANLALNPTSAIWRQSLMFDSNYLALALLQLGEAALALQASQRAWDIVAERLQEEGPQPIWLTARGNFAAQHARALAANGRHAEARPVFELALERARALQAENPGPAADERLAALQADAARSAAA